jgi:F-type H+-transporting ATPase subunit alpha
MEEQVCIIYAGVNGYLDPMPVDRVRAFEEGLLGLLRNQHTDVLNAIRETRDLDDATAGKLKTIVDNYARTFT